MLPAFQYSKGVIVRRVLGLFVRSSHHPSAIRSAVACFVLVGMRRKIFGGSADGHKPDRAP